MTMKKKLQEIKKVQVLKAFAAAHGYLFLAIVVIALAYVLLASVFGRSTDDIIDYAQTAGIFSVIGVIAVLASMAAVYKANKKYLFKKETKATDAIALEVSFVLFALILYFVIDRFNIFSYLFVVLVPTIAAYYMSKKKGEKTKKKKED